MAQTIIQIAQTAIRLDICTIKALGPIMIEERLEIVINTLQSY